MGESTPLTEAEWGPAQRAYLAQARRAYAHTQSQAAAHISSAADVHVDQAQISKWESGLTKRPAPGALDAIRAYIDKSPSAPTVPPTTTEADESAFMRLVERATDEPMLGPRQAALISALTTRLGSGVGMSEGEISLARTLARTLGLSSE